jgi:hypothetical protein
MPPVKPIQTNFTGGEWTPHLDGRVDLEKYGNAVKTCENFIPSPHGFALNRSGFKYVAGTKTNSKESILVPFEFSTTQAYVLEFGDLYIRFYKDQGRIESAGVPVEVTTTYTESQLPDMKFTQSADVLYITHPSHTPRKLLRTSDTSWSLVDIVFKPIPTKEESIEPDATLTPGAVTGTSITFTAGSAVFQDGDTGRIISAYNGTARASIDEFTSTTQVKCNIIDDFPDTSAIASGSWTLEGSPTGSLLPSKYEPVGASVDVESLGDEQTFTDALGGGATNWWAASAGGTNEYYLLQASGIIPATQPDKVYENDDEMVESTAGDLGIKQWAWGDNVADDALGYNTIYVRLSDEVDPDTKNPDTDYVKFAHIDITDVFRSSDVGKYLRISDGYIKIVSYTDAQNIKGVIEKTLTPTTDDDGDPTPDETSIFTIEEAAWSAAKGYPNAIAFHEDRLWFGGTDTYPSDIWGSVSGGYENFAKGTDDGDSVNFTLVSRKVDTIRWLESLKRLVAGTAGSEWTISGTDDGSITPSDIDVKAQTKYGSSSLQPATVGKSIIFLGRDSTRVREISYDILNDGYNAPDLTLLASHISQSGTIQSMAYQETPIPVLWCVRSDGVLLGMTYHKEHEVICWHRHITDGEFERICVIPGGSRDELWAVVKRTVGGSTKRYVELLEAMFGATTSVSAFFVDSGLSYSGAATTTITGLNHLEGKTVKVLADGSNHPDKTVSGGQITLGWAATTAHVGLGYTAKLETLRLNMATNKGTAQGQIKRINAVTLRLYRALTGKVGPDADNLQAINYRTAEMEMDTAPDLKTGDVKVLFNKGFELGGRIYIEQSDPLPFGILAIIPEVEITA